MNESDKATARARARLFVNQVDAFLLQIGQRGVNVFDRDRYVMDSATAFIEKL